MTTKIIFTAGLALLIMITLAPPVAASERLLLSRDGKQWASDLDGPAFDPQVRWVPGDERSTVLWAMNHSGQPAQLTLDLVDVHGATLLADDFVDLTVAVGKAPATEVGPGRILSIPRTPPNEKVKIIITVSMPVSSPNWSQQERISFDLVAELRQIPGESGPSAPPADGGLPGTGARKGIVVLALLGICALLAGVTSVVIGRRKDSTR